MRWFTEHFVNLPVLYFSKTVSDVKCIITIHIRRKIMVLLTNKQWILRTLHEIIHYSIL